MLCTNAFDTLPVIAHIGGRGTEMHPRSCRDPWRSCTDRSACGHAIAGARRAVSGHGVRSGWRRGSGFAYLDPGDGFERGAGDLGQLFVAVIDAEGVIGGFDGDGAT